MKKIVMAMMAGAIMSCAAAESFAAEATDKRVKARRAYFQTVLANAGPLFGMVKGKVAYDAAKAKTFANNLNLVAQMNLGYLWAKGTDNATLKGQTRALPAIWAANSEIGAKAADFSKAVAKLASVAGNGKDAMSGAMKAVGATCGGCHKPYRAKDF
jgi:cytochrome c556